MNRQYTQGYVDRASRESDGPLRFVAATEGRKADGIDLRMSGAQLDRFRSNPIFGYGHDYFGRDSLPIGRATSVSTDGERLLIDVDFDQNDDFARTVERKYRDGYMNAVSVGFAVTEWEGRGSMFTGGVASEWELHEVSAVPVGMDADAVVAGGRGVHVSLDAIGQSVARHLASQLGLTRGAIPAHDTEVVEGEWDGSDAVANAPNEQDTLRHMHAWADPDGDPGEKETYKLPHHEPGTDTAANLNAVRNALARLSQTDMPDSDRDAVERHLRNHLDEQEDDDRSDDETRPTEEGVDSARDQLLAADNWPILKGDQR